MKAPSSQQHSLLALTSLGLGEAEVYFFLSVYPMTNKIEINWDHGSVAEHLPSVHKALGSDLSMCDKAREGD